MTTDSAPHEEQPTTADVAASAPEGTVDPTPGEVPPDSPDHVDADDAALAVPDINTTDLDRA